jgi:hypothetical protein
MQVIEQTLDDLVANLGPLPVEWMDEIAANAIARLTRLRRFDPAFCDFRSVSD